MGKRFLSRSQTERTFSILRHAISDRRNQRHVLSPAEFADGSRLAQKSAGKIYFRRQRQPLYHAYQAAKSFGTFGRKFHPPHCAFERKARPAALAIAAEFQKRFAATGKISETSAAKIFARD